MSDSSHIEADTRSPHHALAHSAPTVLRLYLSHKISIVIVSMAAGGLHRVRHESSMLTFGPRGQSIRAPALAFLHGKSSNGELAMQYQLEALVTCVALFVYVFLRRHRRLSVIRDVPRPANPSWIFGMSPKGQPSPFYLLL